MVVQRGDFIIASHRGPLHNLIRRGFANELLPGKPENFTHVGIGFGPPGGSSYRNVVDRYERDVIYGFRCVLATKPDSNRKNE